VGGHRPSGHVPADFAAGWPSAPTRHGGGPGPAQRKPPPGAGMLSGVTPQNGDIASIDIHASQCVVREAVSYS